MDSGPVSGRSSTETQSHTFTTITLRANSNHFLTAATKDAVVDVLHNTCPERNSGKRRNISGPWTRSSPDLLMLLTHLHNWNKPGTVYETNIPSFTIERLRGESKSHPLHHAKKANRDHRGNDTQHFSLATKWWWVISDIYYNVTGCKRMGPKYILFLTVKRFLTSTPGFELWLSNSCDQSL
jgi:hypothetical protein